MNQLVISEAAQAAFLEELGDQDETADNASHRLDTACAFIERSRIDPARDWLYLDITGALIASAELMDNGSQIMRLALDIKRLQRLAKGDRQEVAA